MQDKKTLCLELPVHFEAVTIFRRAVVGQLGDMEWAKKILLACEEMLVNILMYSGATYIRAELKKEENLFFVSLRDDGIPFDPVAVDMVEKEFEELDSGGMGIALARQIAEEMEYRYSGTENCLDMRFRKETDQQENQ